MPYKSQTHEVVYRMVPERVCKNSNPIQVNQVVVIRLILGSAQRALGCYAWTLTTTVVSD